MSQTRKTFFSRTLSITGGAAVLLSTLMEANGWAATDSHEGGQGMLRPLDETLYVGDDQDVRDAAGGGSTYKGFPLDVGDIENIAAYFAGLLVDPNNTWLYSTNTASIAVSFKGL